MPKRAKELSAMAVSRLSAPGLHAVGGVPGLGLQVTSQGARSWIMRLSIAGRRRELGLGSFPSIGLASARDLARQVRQQVAQGVDPVAERQRQADALVAERAKSKSFKEAAADYIRAHEPGWSSAKHAQQWTNTLAQHAHPLIGALPVSAIDTAHILKVLEPIWHTKTETASRLRGRIEQVLDWAAVRGLRDKGQLNPARWKGHLDKLLPSPKKVAVVDHHPALEVDQVPQFLAALRATPGMGARALEFVVLTGMRSGAVRGARWSEFDFDNAVWTVPAERMKGIKGKRKEHAVPLPKAVMDMLKALPRLASNDLVFFSSTERTLSDMTLTAVMRRMQLEAVPHGFRSTFRDWASERTNHPSEVAEMALAHTIKNKVEAAYRRGDLLNKRRLLMQDWADYCYSGLSAS